jgi:hypothetical protein
MAALTGGEIPYVEITKDGTTYRLPVQVRERRGGEWEPVPVVRQPKLAFPPPLTIAGPEGGGLRRNYDVDEMILTDWSAGMGVDRYRFSAPPSGYAYGTMDTRFDGTLVPRPLATQVGATLGATGGSQKIIELGYTNAQLLWHSFGASASRRLDSSDAWQNTQSGGTNLIVIAAAVGMNGAVATGTDGVGAGIFRTGDGVAWTRMATPAAAAISVIAIFDEKVWILESAVAGTTARTHTASYSADLYSAAAGAGTWTTGASFVAPDSEVMARYFVWQYPLDRGKSTLWLLTNARLLYYDYYASTPAWVTWFSFRRPTSLYTNATWGEVWQKNGNLYVINPDTMEGVWEFTGNTIEQARPNARGGMAAGTRLLPLVVMGNGTQLLVAADRPPDDLASQGALVALTEGKQFHHLYSHPSQRVSGGGVGERTAYVVTTSGANATVWSLDIGDETTLPEHSTTKTYDANACTLVTGWLHGNLINVNKRLLYFEVDAIKASDGSPGLDTGCTIQVEYARRGAAFVSAGTLTDASTFPAVLAISGGYTFKELQVRLTLDRGATTTRAPIMKALKIGYRPRPKQRYTYTARVDLRDDAPAFATADGRYHGLTASYLRGIVDELSDNDDAGADDTLVALAYGGHGNLLHPRRRSASQCEISIQGQESPDGGDGLYLIVASDVSAPSSG